MDYFSNETDEERRLKEVEEEVKRITKISKDQNNLLLMLDLHFVHSVSICCVFGIDLNLRNLAF